MSFVRFELQLAAVGLLFLLAAVSPGDENPRPDPGLYQVRLADGSLVNVRLLTEEVEITTRYGKLKVPAADVRRIDVGFRYPEGVEKRVGEAVARLGDADFKVRDAASEELRRLKERAYPALKQAANSADEEVKRRAAELVRELEDKLPAEQLEIRDHDVLVTPLFPIAGRIEERALKVQSPVFGEVQIPLADIRQVRSLTADSEATQVLLKRVEAAVRRGRTTRTQHMGTGKDPYEEVPKEGALLIGFEVTYGKIGDNPTIMTVCPIFLTSAGRVLGTTHGVPGEGLIRVEAKPGYAVGAVTIKAGGGVDGMSVTFMEIRAGGLDSNRAYESKWLGGMGGGEKTKLGGSGAPVVGIFGRTADGRLSTFNGLGLVMAGWETGEE